MNQQIESQYGCTADLPDLMSRHGVHRLAIVIGGGSSRAPAIAELVEALSSRFEVETIRSTSMLPQLDEIVQALPKLQQFRPDRVVAIGGGRIMDLAKAMVAFADLDHDKLEGYLRGDQNVDSILCPLIAVPTTAGSGSESTHFAVVYRGDAKFSLASQLLRPAIAALDGRMIETVPLRQRASCAFDALAQAIESFWSNGATGDSRDLAAEALRRLVPLLPDRIGTSVPDELQRLLEAANFAGRAIDVSKTTAAHAYSYYFTYYHDISHGRAVGLTLPRLFDVHERASDPCITHPTGPTGFREIMGELRELLDMGDRKASDWFIELQEKLGLGGGLAAIDFELDDALASVNQERLGNNPVQLSQADIDYVFGR